MNAPTHIRRIGISAISLVLLLGVLAFYERRGWIQEMRAQCQAAEPLIAGHATRQDTLQALGEPSGDYGAAEAAWLARTFGEASPKGEDLVAHLRGFTRVLVYSRSNSVMFLYLDPQSRATRSACFLQ